MSEKEPVDNLNQQLIDILRVGSEQTDILYKIIDLVNSIESSLIQCYRELKNHEKTLDDPLLKSLQDRIGNILLDISGAIDVK